LLLTVCLFVYPLSDRTRTPAFLPFCHNPESPLSPKIGTVDEVLSSTFIGEMKMTNEESRNRVMEIFDKAVVDFSEAISDQVNAIGENEGKEVLSQMLTELYEVNKEQTFGDLQMPTFMEIWETEMEFSGYGPDGDDDEC
jgi:hypothetical protein